MTESKDQIRDRILEAFLEQAPFDGWTHTSLRAGAKDAGYDEIVLERVFPGGMTQVASQFAGWSDRRMLIELQKLDVESMKIRERIHCGVKVRLVLNTPYREAIRRLLSFLALPQNAPLAAKLAWRTSSEIWYWAGDRSADWNYYSKRALLASVYSSTILYWLSDDGDDSGDFPESWAFLDRRISDVLRAFGFPKRLKSAISGGKKVLRFSR